MVVEWHYRFHTILSRLILQQIQSNFTLAHFIGNKAKVSAALDVNGEFEKLYQSFDTAVGLYL